MMSPNGIRRRVDGTNTQSKNGQIDPFAKVNPKARKVIESVER